MQAPEKNTHPQLPLSCDNLLVIVGGGAVDKRLLVQLHGEGAQIIAADGGADICADAGIVPMAIIGDMDSLNDPANWATKTRLFEIEEQQTTDFEKCLYATKAPVTVAIGMTGKRFDHTLAALDVVTRYAKNRHIILVDEYDLAFGVAGDFSFAVAAGERVSIYPLGRVAFARSTGLRYPLDGLILEPGVQVGTSNAATHGAFSIWTQQGQDAAWLMIIERHHLSALVAKLG